MSELETYRERVLSVRERLAALPQIGRGHPGPADETTGERWDRLNILGHVAEMLPFWAGQVEAIRDGAAGFGRGEEGYAHRRDGIDRGAERDESALRADIEAGIERLVKLLDGLAPAALEKRAIYRAQTGDREVDLRYPLEELLVGHLEAHVRQLEELG